MTKQEPSASRSEQGMPWTFEKVRTRTVVRDCNGGLLFIIEGPMDSHREACGKAIETMKAALSVRSERGTLLRPALIGFCEAFTNRNQTTSLKEWNYRMKIAHANALEALAGREPYSDPQ